MIKKNARIIISVMFLIFSFIHQAFALGKQVGMVMEVKGNAELVVDGKGEKLSPMQLLMIGDRIQTGENARVQVVMFANNRALYLMPSSMGEVNETGLKILKGKIEREQKVNYPLPKNLALESRKVLGETVRFGRKNGSLRSNTEFALPSENASVFKENVTLSWIPLVNEDIIYLSVERQEENGDWVIMADKQKLEGTSTFYVFKKLEPGRYSAFIETGTGRPVEIARIRFNVLSEEKETAIKEQMEITRRLLGKNPNDLKPRMAMVAYLMENKLYMEALGQVEKLRLLLPGNENVDTFKKLIYKKFLMN
ncbi:MAG: hypothetical protein ACLFQV_11170 [Vulcanimicrobiota bacterium]